MYKGNQYFCKNEICIYLMILLLIDKKLDPIVIMRETNISRLTLVRYISTLKNAMFDFGFYNVRIWFDRSYSVYRCSIE